MQQGVKRDLRLAVGGSEPNAALASTSSTETPPRSARSSASSLRAKPSATGS